VGAVVTAKASTTVGERFRAVRDASGLLQRDFVARLNEASIARFGTAGPRYDPSRVSRLENDRQVATLEDVAIYADVDPLHRGKLWVGWCEAVDATLRVPAPPLREYFGEEVVAANAARQAAEQKKAALGRSGQKGGRRA
jgi:transcriptional regulator with XRE-family HTH domain